MKSTNPATGEVFAEYSLHDDQMVERRIARAAETFTHWRATSFGERSRLFQKLAHLLKSGKNAFAYTMSSEMGKPLAQARSEVGKCALVCEYFAEKAPRALAAQHVDTEAQRSQILFEPLGAVFAIMPWNFPFWQVFRFAAPTLMAGNVALLKHAPNVGGCATHIVDLFRQAGFPKGVFDKLFLTNEKAAEVIADSRIRAVTLTGSTRAGRAVAKRAGESLKPCVLELGGSDPFIVLEDADIDRAVDRGLFARMMNNGQSCIAAKRFFLHESIASEFTEKFVEKARALQLGDPLDESTDLGPMARADLRADLHRQVEDSIQKGAHALLGAEIPDGPGYFYPPTVLTEVKPGMPAFDEELFGPAAAFIVVKDADQAIALANQSSYGLGASIWTDSRRGRKLAPKLEVGAVFVNEMVKSDPRLPFGGVKNSGFGRELSSYGLLEFVNIKSLWVQ